MRFPLFAVLSGLVIASLAVAAPRDDLWLKVKVARDQRLPRSAIEALDAIIPAALSKRAYPEAIKAIGQKVALEQEIEGHNAAVQVKRLQAELAKAPAEMRPVLETLLARWYWEHFQQNRWRFMQRTQTGAAAGTDIETWDLARILTEIDARFTAALSAEAALKKIPIGSYDALLDRTSVPDIYRPTLYDFLVYQALEFYQAGEQAAVEAEDSFVPEAGSPFFGETDAFMRWQPETSDTEAPALKAIRLYQKLLQFHQRDRDRSAYFDADLARIRYANNVAVGEDKEARYVAALERFIRDTADHEISARALAALAEHYRADDDPARAHELARQGLDAFPESAGGAMCFNLLQQIEAPSAALSTEAVWNAPWPTLDVNYRNTTEVHFRAIAVDFEEYATHARWGFGQVEPNFARQLLARSPALAWSAPLPATKDFKLRQESLPAPTTLKPGFYILISSHRADFSDDENQIQVRPVWVSDLALVLRQSNDNRLPGGFLLRAGSGDPVASAAIQVWRRTREGRLERAERTTTDRDGRFTIPVTERNPGGIIVAEHAGQTVSSIHETGFWRGGPGRELPEHTFFFTDRALYRPGQSIHYKGIVIRSEPAAANYQAVGRRRISVAFHDANNQEIGRADHVTNEYGSFAGTFTAPRDRALGQMSLQAPSDMPGVAYFRVEEFKRPKFLVELAAAGDAPRLGARAKVGGKATAYTGAAIGGAQVKWRVERSAQMPYWCWWWPVDPPKAIAHGTATTAADGSFTVEFNAEPDRSVPEKNEPVFTFTVHADVTDTTGETRSDQHMVRVGYTALQATLQAEPWQEVTQPVKFSVATHSLDGLPRAAKGQITIHALKEPVQVTRAAPAGPFSRWMPRRTTAPAYDASNPDTWELAREVAELGFTTDDEGKTEVKQNLPAGIYRAVLETKDRFGKKVAARHTFTVVDPATRNFAAKVPHYFVARDWAVEPGEQFLALWGTGYDRGRAYVELERDGKPLRSFWTPADRTQESIALPITEEMRGGVTVRITYVRENRAYFEQQVVQVPWSDRELSIKWESFRSKLQPGQQETWTAIVEGPDAERASAEMVATLYDASLDQFAPHGWMNRFPAFRHERSQVNSSFQNTSANFLHVAGNWHRQFRPVHWDYRDFGDELGAWRFGYGHEMVTLSPFAVAASAPAEGYAAASTLAGSRMEKEVRDMGKAVTVVTSQFLADTAAVSAGAPPPPPANLDQVTARRNLNETAFFFPHLQSDENGVVRMQFTMPEALTEWKFLGFAHDQQLRAGLLAGKAVTAKDLMVEPNPPRFVREGDVLEFTVKVSNTTDQPKSGRVRLTFADAQSLASTDAALGNRDPEKEFTIPAKEARTFSWRITIPDGAGFLTYKAVGASGQTSDGEEGFLPVLSRRILVTESLPLPIRGRTTREFNFAKLLESSRSDTLRHQSLTVQMVSQPAWYAVMALPYLMEFPYECSEQIFNRLYANSLARHVAGSDPKIRRVFDRWKATPALDSPLAKNEDLKSVLLEETPWMRQAANESEARRNVGLLFDANRLDAEMARALNQLSERQLDGGLWPWFAGGRPSEYISLYIATGFGRLRHLGADIDVAPALRAFGGLDAWMAGRHREILTRLHPEEYIPSYLDALWLYGRSFFLEDQPVADEHRAALDFFLRQSRRFWAKLDSRQSHAHLALGLQRFGDRTTPAAIMRSLKERSSTSEELGMFWRDNGASWWWYQAPIETQAMMIEAFDEVAQDAQAVEDCKVWLLKQKQTQDWRTTKATADAVYGLLRRGTSLLASDALVEVAVGGQTIRPEKTEAGTGFYEERFARTEIKPEMGRITVRKTDEGVSWGSVHWQYLEDMAKVTPHESTPLTLKKALFIKETTSRGPVLKPVTGPVAVGDELVVRLELRTDRDMEYVHLKDQRGSGTEPVNVLSRYKYQDGLGYYESTRDTASHFFIEYLPRGTYVFEYSTRVQLRGAYQTGIAEIQCMYAPEFNSHSQSIPIEVK